MWSQIFQTTAVFCEKFVQKVPNMAFIRRALRKYPKFGLIYKSFEIHLATITTGLLSSGMKNP